MDPSRYSTFSSIDKSHHAVRRLLGTYLPAFDDVRAFVESGLVLFLSQKDAMPSWRPVLGSAVAAVSWDVLKGTDVVMVLLDDHEFGKDIVWYLSRSAVHHVDFKLLLLFVETSLEMMLHVVREPSIADRLAMAPVVDVPVVERGTGRVRSPSFCLSVEPGTLVPPALDHLVSQLAPGEATPPLRDVFLTDVPFKAPVFSWAVLAGLRACVARDAGCMGGTLHVRLDKAILSQDDFSRSLLLMVKLQLEALASMLAATLGQRTDP